MRRRNFITGSMAGGTIASLLALAPKSRNEALADFKQAIGQSNNSDYLTIEPASTSFRSLTTGFNARWTAPNASVVYIPLTETGIASAMAASQCSVGGCLGVRGGGHCYENFVFNEGRKAILDMSLVNQVGFDRQKGVYYAQAGANNFDLQSTLVRLGKTLPGGSCPTVGLGGHVSGGGFGVLSRLYGLTVDWLTGVSVTHMKSRNPNTISVSRESTGYEADLFWAHTGGGGGNFGVINRYEFEKLPDAPAAATVTIYGWDWSTIRLNGGANYLYDIISGFEAMCAAADNTSFLLLKLAHQDAGQVQIIRQDVQFDSLGLGSPSRSPRSILQRYKIDQVSSTLIPLNGHPYIPEPTSQKQMDWWQSVVFFGAGGPGPYYFKNKSAYLNTGFTKSDVDKIYFHLTRQMEIKMSDALLQVDSYGGRISDVARNATAAWHRGPRFTLQYQTYWSNNKGSTPLNLTEAINLKWIRDFYTDIYAHLGGIPDQDRDKTGQWDGAYISYPDVDLNNNGLLNALRLYYGTNLPRLIKTKAYWDPNNYFQHQQSIPVNA